MEKLSQQNTFKGEVFTPVSIPGRREEGFNRPVLHVNEAKTKVILVSSSEEVKAVISSADGSELLITNF